MESVVKEPITMENCLSSTSDRHGSPEAIPLNMPEYAIEERKLVWKIDLRILPLMLVAYMLQFVDKQALGSSVIMGILQDLKLDGSNYSWATSIFYFGYLAASYPLSLIFVKLPLGKTLGVASTVWAIILACHAVTKNFTTITIARFFLGAAEASITPGFSLVTSLWYTPSEQPLRHGLWFAGNSASGLFASLLSYGVYHIHGALPPWKWLFIILGAATFVCGVSLFLWIPDHPETTKFLTENERKIALDRLRRAKAGNKTNKYNFAQVKDALKDYQTWMLVVYTLAGNIPNGGYLAFSSLILNGLGFSILKTFLMGMPIAAVTLVVVLLTSWAASKLKNARCYLLLIVNCMSLLGSILVYSTHRLASRYIGLCLMATSSAGMPLSLSLVSSNIGGFTKRSTVSALVFVSYCVGNIIGPQLFFAREAPKYQSGFLAIIVCYVIIIAVILLLRWYLVSRNKVRMGAIVAEEDTRRDVTLEISDITDTNNKRFFYQY